MAAMWAMGSYIRGVLFADDVLPAVRCMFNTLGYNQRMDRSLVAGDLTQLFGRAWINNTAMDAVTCALDARLRDVGGHHNRSHVTSTRLFMWVRSTDADWAHFDTCKQLKEVRIGAKEHVLSVLTLGVRSVSLQNAYDRANSTYYSCPHTSTETIGLYMLSTSLCEQSVSATHRVAHRRRAICGSSEIS
jgi:hypothetical protein